MAGKKQAVYFYCQVRAGFNITATGDNRDWLANE
jgi:hypothetical protein